jgi:hypothetical protein
MKYLLMLLLLASCSSVPTKDTSGTYRCDILNEDNGVLVEITLESRTKQEAVNTTKVVLERLESHLYQRSELKVQCERIRSAAK